MKQLIALLNLTQKMAEHDVFMYDRVMPVVALKPDVGDHGRVSKLHTNTYNISLKGQKGEV